MTAKLKAAPKAINMPSNPPVSNPSVTMTATPIEAAADAIKIPAEARWRSTPQASKAVSNGLVLKITTALATEVFKMACTYKMAPRPSATATTAPWRPTARIALQ